MKRVPKLSTEDSLAMFRCAMYSAMGVGEGEQKPTDRQCLEWLQRVIGQAEHRNNPPITLFAHPPIACGPLPDSALRVPVVVQRWDAAILLPDWRDLPR